MAFVTKLIGTNTKVKLPPICMAFVTKLIWTDTKVMLHPICTAFVTKLIGTNGSSDFDHMIKLLFCKKKVV